MVGEMRGRKSGGRIRYRGRQEKNPRTPGGRLNGNLHLRVVVAGRNFYVVPETWDVRGSQDPMGMTLAKMANSGEIEYRETISSR